MNDALILLVDDNVQNIQLLGKLLAGNGYRLGVASSGAEALEFTRHSIPDLILLDIMMPEMDGYEVCRRLKENSLTRHVPIIFLTARTEERDILKAFEAGGVDYVTKPFNSAELLVRVKTHVEMKILRGILPICASCKNIRDDEGFWKQIESYISEHSHTSFSHSICPQCAEKLYKGQEWYTGRSS